MSEWTRARVENASGASTPAAGLSAAGRSSPVVTSTRVEPRRGRLATSTLFRVSSAPSAQLLLVAASLGVSFSCGGTSTNDPEYPPHEVAVSTEQLAPSAEPTRAPLADAPNLISLPSESPIVVLRAVFQTGSSSDPEGRYGITELTARAMAESGVGSLSYRQVEERLYPMAGEIGVRVSRDQVVFVGRVHRDRLEEFYPLFRDTLLDPHLGQEDFERIKAQMLSELTLELRGNDDEALGKAVLQSMLYEGHPYAHPTLGTVASLNRLRVDDIRAHRHRVFCAGRLTIGIAGGANDAFAQRVLRDLSMSNWSSCLGRAHLPDASSEGGRIWLVDKPSASSVAVSMGHRIDVTRDDEDYPALVLAVAWLGQHRQFVGRLMQSIREQRGMNYGDYAYPEHFEQDGWGVFPAPNVARRQQYFSIWLRPLRPEQAHFGIRLALYEFRQMLERGLTDEDVTRMRAYLSGYYALFLQTESRRLGFGVDDAFYGSDRPWLERLRQTWEGLNAEAVNAVIRRHLAPDRLQLAIVAPGARDFAERLASEARSPIDYPARTVPDAVREVDRVVEDLSIGIPADRIHILPVADLFEN